MSLTLTDDDRAIAAGERGPAAAMAMRIVIKLAEAAEAPRLLDITAAHIDACHYVGQAGLDFAQQLADDEGRVVVPTTLNVSSIDLLHPDLFVGDPEVAEASRRIMAAYASMGCEPSWTCAPYQLEQRPGLGDQIAWGESNAIVFVNSVLGARTERYGDFSDICAALTGRVPDAGLHREEHRHAWSVFRLDGVADALLESDDLYPVLGHWIGKHTGVFIPAITGLPASVTEDQMKALGAAAASSGGVAMFHAVGVTPEAPTLDEASGGAPFRLDTTVTMSDLREARADLSTVADANLTAVTVGTPHFSVTEFEELASILSSTGRDLEVPFYVNTGRRVLAEAAAAGLLDPIRDAGIEVVTDTCVYMGPFVAGLGGTVMTNSGKAAYYAPANLGVDVAFGSLADCVASAEAGRVVRDEELWA